VEVVVLLVYLEPNFFLIVDLDLMVAWVVDFL
jgi:hypothetical protein